MRTLWGVTTAVVVALALVATGGPQANLRAEQGGDANVVVDPSLYGTLSYRSLGFSRGGPATAVAVAVAEADPNVVYVGTGSACPRGNISAGVGMYKSLDAGTTWQHIGVCAPCQIARVQVHPKDP